MSEQEPLTDEDLEAMARRAAAASPAPWWAWVEGRDGYGGDNVILIGPRGTDNELPDMYVNHVSAGGSQPAPVEDLDFIANARQDIPRLIAEVRRLREVSGQESQSGRRPAKDLKTLLADHMAEPFPASVSKGDDYGEVSSVLIGPDICGWASRVVHGAKLSPDERRGLTTARDELRRSLDTFPQDARPYYQLLVNIADAALTQ